jgi:hypothetical protein
MNGRGQDIAALHASAHFYDTLPVNADAAFLDQLRRERSRLN